MSTPGATGWRGHGHDLARRALCRLGRHMPHPAPVYPVRRQGAPGDHAVAEHSWQVPLYVSPRGLTTGLMFVGGRGMELEFDLVGAAAVDPHRRPAPRPGARAPCRSPNSMPR